MYFFILEIKLSDLIIPSSLNSVQCIWLQGYRVKFVNYSSADSFESSSKSGIPCVSTQTEIPVNNIVVFVLYICLFNLRQSYIFQFSISVMISNTNIVLIAIGLY